MRRSLLALRRGIHDQQRREWDAALCDQVLFWLDLQQVASLGIYWPMAGEPDLRALYATLAARGMPLALPRVTASDAPLQFAQWAPHHELVKDTMGVSNHAEPQLVERPAALLIPCVGFNAGRYRLGYGGGYYDRTLAATPRPQTVGIAYRCLAAEFAAAPHDVALDAIVTEAGLL
ncbi:5-formyltetrahydrofolate cyclo-ligase [Undibacterium arcticum]